MGRFAEYINGSDDMKKLTRARKEMLKRISKLRDGNDVLVYAADFSNESESTFIDQTDIIAVQDQLENLPGGRAIDIVLETQGGSGVVVEDIVDLIRAKYEYVGMIIPGQAKSAGTIFALAGNDILMGNGSALGPIDAQVMDNGRFFSADAFLEIFQKIKEEMDEKEKLSPVYVPILQRIPLSQIRACEHAQCFSKHLVQEWLAKYKFKSWKNHSNGHTVTDREKQETAKRIAAELGSQSKWFTHARSIKIKDLEELGLKIVDYSKKPKLNDAITRYYMLLRIMFERTGWYKMIETETSQIYRGIPLQPETTLSPPDQFSRAALPGPASATVQYTCPECARELKVQLRLEKGIELEEGALPYPVDTDTLNCPKCNYLINMKHVREHIEEQTGRRGVE